MLYNKQIREVCQASLFVSEETLWNAPISKKEVSVKHFLIRFVNTELIRKGFMVKRLTSQEVLKRFKEVHGDMYIYDKFVFVNTYTQSEIGCREHGYFKQTPKMHMLGQGCRKCGINKTSNSHKLTQDEFVNSVIKIHGDIFDLTNTVYEGSNKSVKLSCKICGSSFNKLPRNLLNNKTGCPDCGKLSSANTRNLNFKNYFEKRAREVHGDLYEYSIEDYDETSDIIKIFCKNHNGKFSQNVHSHLHGRGCPQCSKSGFKNNISAFLYVLKSDNFSKVGISNKNPEGRAKKVSTSSGEKFEIVYLFKFKEGHVALNVERMLLRALRDNFTNPPNKFDGYTETFCDVDAHAIGETVQTIVFFNPNVQRLK